MCLIKFYSLVRVYLYYAYGFIRIFKIFLRILRVCILFKTKKIYELLVRYVFKSYERTSYERIIYT